MTAQEKEALPRAAGRRLAAVRRLPAGDARMLLKRAMAVLDELGGLTELQEEGEETSTIYGLRCPFAALVKDHPQACLLAEAFLSELTGAPVQQRCACTGSPHCCFIVQRSRPEAGG